MIYRSILSALLPKGRSHPPPPFGCWWLCKSRQSAGRWGWEQGVGVSGCLRTPFERYTIESSTRNWGVLPDCLIWFEDVVHLFVCTVIVHEIVYVVISHRSTSFLPTRLAIWHHTEYPTPRPVPLCPAVSVQQYYSVILRLDADVQSEEVTKYNNNIPTFSFYSCLQTLNASLPPSYTHFSSLCCRAIYIYYKNICILYIGKKERKR